MRIGQGYDVHRLAQGRRLILGGVDIPYEKGLLGHSDADVLVHAVMDALLGAAALGDIGQHFPDTDPAYEGISSIALLEKVGELLDGKGYVIENMMEGLMKPFYLEDLEKIRRSEAVFNTDAEVYTKDYNDTSILWIVRKAEGEELHAVFNFSDQGKTVWMPERAVYTNLVTGVKEEVETVELSGWDFIWMKR